MNDNIPENETEFLTWMSSKGFVIDDKTERVYSVNSRNILSEVRNHAFFRGIDAYLQRCDEEYLSHNSVHLLMNHSPIILHLKSYTSVINKSFRQDVIFNKRFPNPPKDGFITPDNWFETLNDIVRTTIVCKYVDGPKYISQLLKDYASSLSVDCEYVSQQRDVGYYAYHVYVKLPIDIVDIDFNQRQIGLTVELQIRTQLQDMMYDITHQFYEEARDIRASDPNAWKWDVTSNRFTASYLSHTLHLLEGLIINLRDQYLTSGGVISQAPDEENNE